MTDRGWAIGGAGIAALALWILLGEVELLVAGAGLVGAIGLALLTVRAVRPKIGVVRRLLPNLVHEGETAEVKAMITNQGRLGVRNLTVSDIVEAMGSADFEVGRLRPRETVHATYRITCRRRGVYTVGPASLRVSDSARLVSRPTGSEGVDRLVVYPAIEELIGFPIARGMDPSLQAARPEFANRGGEDFFTLREYLPGDDLRFIHWPSSAKGDTLLIRQMETPWQQRALIILDLRRQAYDNAGCFEHAVRAMASLVVHYGQGGYDSLVWVGGTAPVPGSRTVAVMEKLALAETDDRLDLRILAGRIRQKGGGGTLLLVSGTPDAAMTEFSRLLGHDYGATLALCATNTPSTFGATMHRAGIRTIERSPGQRWADGWREMMEGR